MLLGFEKFVLNPSTFTSIITATLIVSYNSQTETGQQDPPPDEDEQPLVCMICEDKATGLHYGIITCEG